MSSDVQPLPAKSVVTRIVQSEALYLVVGILGLCIHLLAAKDLYQWYDRMLAAVLLWIFLGVAFRFARADVRTAPIVPLATFQLYLMYGVAQFTQESAKLAMAYYVPSSHAVTTAMLIAVIGDIGFVCAWALAAKLSHNGRHALVTWYPEPTRSWDKVVVVYGLVGVVEYYVTNLRNDAIPVELRQLMLVVLSPCLALVLVLFLGYRYQSRLLRQLGLLMVLLMMLIGVLTSMMENIIVPLYIFIASSWIWGNSIKLRWIIAPLLIFVVLNPVKYHYRALAWKGDDSINSIDKVYNRLGKWQEAMVRTWDDPFATEHTVETTSARTSAVLALAQVVDWVPETVPYKSGEGLATSLLFFIPRFMWPSKPMLSDLVNNKYAVSFRLTTSRGTRTATYGIPQPADGYWDFGIPGALGYLAVMGFLIGFLFGRGGPDRQIGQILALVFSGTFFQALGSFFNLVASLFTLFVGAWIALRIMAAFSAQESSRTRAAESLHIVESGSSSG